MRGVVPLIENKRFGSRYNSSSFAWSLSRETKKVDKNETDGGTVVDISNGWNPGLIGPDLDEWGPVSGEL
jgi:hypothetical protein